MRAAILLAAGHSQRFGRADKLMAALAGRPLLAHALDRAAASDAHRILLVVRRRTVALERLARRYRSVRIVVARDAASGLSSSLRTGLAALRPIDREAWVFLADMPDARAPTSMRLAAGERAARPLVGDAPGHPMLIRTCAALNAVATGDRGLASLPARRWRGEAGNILDIDDRAALRRRRCRAR